MSLIIAQCKRCNLYFKVTNRDLKVCGKCRYVDRKKRREKLKELR